MSKTKSNWLITIGIMVVISCLALATLGAFGYLLYFSNLDTKTAQPVAFTPGPTSTPAPPTSTLLPTNTLEPTVTAMPTNTPVPTVPLDPASELEAKIKKNLGSNNRGLPTITDFKINPDGLIFVVWPLQDNLTEGMIKRGGMTDIIAILKAVSEMDSQLDYNQVDCIGTFSMVDAYGNAEEKDVIRTSYKRETVNRINWDNFITDDIYVIADFENNHPVFKP